MEYVFIEKWYDTVLENIINPFYKNKYKVGIINNFNTYVMNKLSDRVKKDERHISIPESSIDDIFIDEYFIKRDSDYSAKDCAYMYLRHMGIPPIEQMSVESLEKTIRDSFDGYNDKAYIKLSKRNVETVCVDWNTACEISKHPDVENLIQKQIEKAENKEDKQCSNIKWRAYEFEKEKIASLEAMNSSEIEEDAVNDAEQSEVKKTNLMVEAIFKNLFSEIDFEKYKKDYDEMELLYDNWEFGERYQKLYDTFHAPNYNWEYYKPNMDNPVIDALADKIAERIVKIMNNKKD